LERFDTQMGQNPALKAPSALLKDPTTSKYLHWISANNYNQLLR
jgi:hypothetical protein